jgi:hypothetical protein
VALNRTLKKWLMLPFAAKYVRMPGRSYRRTAPPLTELELTVQERCRQHIAMLANQIGERHFGCPQGLNAARAYIREQLALSARDVIEHRFALPEGEGVNLIACLPGLTPQTIVIGAHYDSVRNCPAANDNGSGVAAMLELVGMLAREAPLEMTLRFVAFDNEEHLGTPATHMGSYLYAKRCREENDDLVGMWSLETVGCFSEEPDSQRYPAPFNLFYPTVGNFVGFIGTESSVSWIRKSVGAFRHAATMPSEGVAAPAKFTDVERSDHWGFGQFGYPALMVTDTANFRYPHYHTAGDTIDQINFPQLARLISGLAAATRLIARGR